MSKTDNKNCNGWISTSEALPPLKTRVLIVESGAGRSMIRIAKLLGQAQSGVWYWSAQKHSLTSYPLAAPATTP